MLINLSSDVIKMSVIIAGMTNCHNRPQSTTNWPQRDHNEIITDHIEPKWQKRHRRHTDGKRENEQMRRDASVHSWHRPPCRFVFPWFSRLVWLHSCRHLRLFITALQTTIFVIKISIHSFYPTSLSPPFVFYVVLSIVVVCSGQLVAPLWSYHITTIIQNWTTNCTK